MRIDPASHPIFRAVRHWRDRCLLGDGSVFTDEAIWTSAHVDALVHHFIENPQEGGETFIVKLGQQLSDGPPGARKLASEMLWVMYLQLSASSMGPETKRLQIRQAWEWSGDPFPGSHWTLQDEVLGSGISHAGTGYHTHRWREFRFFIDLLRDWKKLDRGEQRRLLGDGWEMASWIEGRKYAPARQLRHMLLFLLFPDDFERMTTASHKRKVIRTFREKLGEDPKGVDYGDRIQLDREVLRIRERLAEDAGEDPQDLDFYAEPLVSEWLRVKETDSVDEGSGETDLPEAEAWVQARFGDSRIWLISPGEGARQWRAFREEAVVALGWDYLGDLAEYGGREEIQALIAEKEGKENPVNDSLAVWQFVHEMAEGHVVVAKRGRGRLLGWGRITGPYEHDPDRSEYRNLRPVRWEKVGDWVLPSDRQGPAKTLTEIRKYPRMVRRYFHLMEGDSAPGEHDSPSLPYSVKDATEDLFLEPEEFSGILDTLVRKKNVVLQGPPGVGKTYMARKLAWALIGRKDPMKVGFVQFHQSYAYEDFVQGWRPNQEGGFQLHNGVFHRFCTRAREDDGGAPHVFIIDEINRANLSRTLGELMMLVEGDKRGPSHAIPLTYSPEESFYVPENVYVVGLMNTADRSLALVDYALRRRFSFVDLDPAFGRDRFMSYLVEAGVAEALVNRIDGRMRELNDAIQRDRRNLGPGFEVGHSYFVPGPEDENLDDAWYAAIVETEVAPLLREYWFDRPDEADNHIRRLLQ